MMSAFQTPRNVLDVLFVFWGMWKCTDLKHKIILIVLFVSPLRVSPQPPCETLNEKQVNFYV